MSTSRRTARLSDATRPRLGAVNRIAARIAAINESATLKVDAKAKSLKAAGRDVISYAAGEPDFATPPNIVEAAQRALADPKNYRYTPAAGLPELREAVAAKTRRDSGLEVEPSQVLVTNGGKQSVYQAFQTILDPGDEVLVPTPYWTRRSGLRQVRGEAGAASRAGTGGGNRASVRLDQGLADRQPDA